MNRNTLEQLLNDGCVHTGNCNCDYCPYVIYASDNDYARLCEKEVYEQCIKNSEEAEG